MALILTLATRSAGRPAPPEKTSYQLTSPISRSHELTPNTRIEDLIHSVETAFLPVLPGYRRPVFTFCRIIDQQMWDSIGNLVICQRVEVEISLYSSIAVSYCLLYFRCRGMYPCPTMTTTREGSTGLSVVSYSVDMLLDL